MLHACTVSLVFEGPQERFSSAYMRVLPPGTWALRDLGAQGLAWAQARGLSLAHVTMKLVCDLASPVCRKLSLRIRLAMNWNCAECVWQFGGGGSCEDNCAQFEQRSAQEKCAQTCANLRLLAS